MTLSSGQLQNTLYCAGHGRPAGRFRRELFAAPRGQLVNSRAACRAFRDPLCAYKASLFHPVQRGVQRPCSTRNASWEISVIALMIA
jgi:hypothetical protein